MDAHETLYPPLATITPDDHRGVAWVISIICLSHIYLTLAVRLSVRWRRFQLDDYALVIACVLVLCQSSLVFGAVGMGMGWSGAAGAGDGRIATTWRVSSDELSDLKKKNSSRS